MNDEHVSGFPHVVKFRILNPFLHTHAASFPSLSIFVMESFHLTALGGPLQTRQNVDCDNGGRHSVHLDVVAGC